MVFQSLLIHVTIATCQYFVASGDHELLITTTLPTAGSFFSLFVCVALISIGSMNKFCVIPVASFIKSLTNAPHSPVLTTDQSFIDVNLLYAVVSFSFVAGGIVGQVYHVLVLL